MRPKSNKSMETLHPGVARLCPQQTVHAASLESSAKTAKALLPVRPLTRVETPLTSLVSLVSVRGGPALGAPGLTARRDARCVPLHPGGRCIRCSDHVMCFAKSDQPCA